MAQQDVLEDKLSTPELLQAIETAGLTKWFTTLKATTAKLHAVADLRVDEVNENFLKLVHERQNKKTVLPLNQYWNQLHNCDLTTF